MGQKKTGNPLKSFTLWFVLLGAVIVWMNLKGHDSKSIVMIHLNPILSFLCGVREYREVIGAISGAWHFLSLMTITGYGMVLDGFRALLQFINKQW